MDWKQTSYGSYCHPYAVKRVDDHYRAYYLIQDGPRQRPQLLTTSGQTAGGYNGALGSNQHVIDRAIVFYDMEDAQAACEIHAGHLAKAS